MRKENKDIKWVMFGGMFIVFCLFGYIIFGTIHYENEIERRVEYCNLEEDYCNKFKCAIKDDLNFDETVKGWGKMCDIEILQTKEIRK